MSNQAWRSVIDRKPVIHRPNCPTLEPQPNAVALPDADALTGQASEDAIRYGLSVRPHYETLKRSLGQISGFLILAYGSPKSDALDIEAVTAAREQFFEARDGLHGLRPPAVGAAHYCTLLDAAELLEGAFALLDHKGFRQSDDKRAEVAQRMKRVHRLILSTSDDRFAMTMVDFTHACCNCASPSAPVQNEPQAN